MARDQSLLSSTKPIAIAPADPYIAHVYALFLTWHLVYNLMSLGVFSQLRDLLVCPRLPGLVNYVANRAIIEQDLHARGAVSSMFLALSNCRLCPLLFATAITSPC